VVIEQTEFLCTKFSKDRKINGSKIHEGDIEFLLKEAKKQVVLNDSKQSIIHIFNHNYIVDGKEFIEEPIDVYADYLSHEMTFITMPKNNIKNIYQAFIDCDIEVERFISCTFALAAKLLNNNELQYGSTLIDVGFEKTSLGLFKNSAIVHSITFPIGVNHITKDIAKVCSLSLEESDTIKNNVDLSFQENTILFNKKGYLIDTYFINSTYRKISQSLILNVVKARLDEIFKIIKKQIDLLGLNSTSGAKIFLVGGGANLYNLEQYCSNLFETDVKKLESINNGNDADEINENFNSCLGALKIIKDGWETEAIPAPANNNVGKMSFFAKIFGNKT
jgi:cell division protein FtsA